MNIITQMIGLRKGDNGTNRANPPNKVCGHRNILYNDRMAKKTTKAQRVLRVHTVSELLLSDTPRNDIVQYGKDKWGVSSKTVDNYIGSASSSIIQDYHKLRSEALSKPIAINAKHYIHKKKQRKSNCVYLIGAPNGLVKIGIANDVQARFRDINNMSPIELHIIHSFSSDDSPEIEKELHGHFGGKRVKGEWFNLTQDDIIWIKERYEQGEQEPESPSILNYRITPSNPDDFVQKTLFDYG